MTETSSQDFLPGTQLSRLCAQSIEEIALCAPFIKADALGRVVESVPRGVRIRCVTRWRPEEIVLGVSDTDVWPLLKHRGDSSLYLCNNLHAKYYRADENCLVGSANITAAALGWAHQPNLELLIPMPAGHHMLVAFESQVFQTAAEVDDGVYAEVLRAVQAIPKEACALVPRVESLGVQVSSDAMPGIQPRPSAYWLPSLRSPEDLFLAYSGRTDRLSSSSRETSAHDLSVLAVPSGLPKDAFRAYVGVILLQMPMVHRVDALLTTPRRFGAVRDAIALMMPPDVLGFDAGRAWQTLMRWFRFFLPDRYRLAVPRHSEVFGRVT